MYVTAPKLHAVFVKFRNIVTYADMCICMIRLDLTSLGVGVLLESFDLDCNSNNNI